MSILIVLILAAYFWGCWVFTTRQDSTDKTASQQHTESGVAGVSPGFSWGRTAKAVAPEGISVQQGWSALDDHQLARLLEESAS